MSKTIKGLLLVMGLICFSVQAQDSAVGSWEGKLEVTPGTTISVIFDVTEEAGALKAVLNSPDMGAIKNITASSVTFTAGKLDIAVDALSGSYSGMLADGSFTGAWTQPGSTIPMSLSPFAAKVLSAAAKATLMGQWHGKLQGPGISFNIIFHFEESENGEFLGFIQNPDAGPQKQPMADIMLENGELFFRVPAASAEYRGMLAGDAISGSLKQGPQNMVLNLARGEFVAEEIVLELTDADFATLAGKWTGAITTPQGNLEVAMRFERDDSGKVVAYFDSLTQGANGLKITSASLTDGHLKLELTVPPANYEGDLGESEITGTWSQMGNSLPLNLAKAE